MQDFQLLLAAGRDFKQYAQDGLATEIAAVHSFQQRLSAQALPLTTLQQIAAIDKGYSLLVAAEMWCPDCQINLCAMALLCQMQPHIEMKIISKARAERALKMLLGIERIAIPYVLVLDQHQQLAGQFIEQPQTVIKGNQVIREAYRRGEHLHDTLYELLHIISPQQK
ncbi:hypothetical protein BL250_04320 [Erwinia sp. OLTSP20]|uniref:thioredoxin family protein n=1 Tax=unclassified Erwinia TaxID=2622719 RepID=UPI000C58F31D|nr:MULTISPECIES: thioredoxin family protein [unclassified Erwinia]PIJ51739.1 hypothetical protein BV501_03250 [Erwinia sp. OAMSP11]PIJ75625.1 hypothetical protein BK416_01545 [Erwinia sp. OLSSP12]PIJ84930.1 hypothetical protein BLD47_01475 [Erwinia sp. OLCASP19]PIJ86710.1 hypothetical protein BLD46_03075 [Erwinia sp. OLMTSP26]PIJ88151.1 hypothetical protein BLD49_03755 [Erwinia sp. OLMDSP33]